MKRKNMRLRKMSLILGIFTCLALIGVGFAAWTITLGGSTTATGEIKVETVSTKTYTVSVSAKSDSSSEIRFTSPSTMSTSNAWLTSDATSDHEKLTAVFVVTVSYTDSEGTKDNVQVNYTNAQGSTTTTAGLATLSTNFAITDTSAGAFATALQYNAVDAVYASGKDLSDCNIVSVEEKVDSTSGTNKYSYEVTVTFKWGSHFGASSNATTNTNPYDFYNAHKATDKVSEATDAVTYSSDAATYLGYIAALSGVKYTLTISVEV